jgi:saccharopine dehydrogenase-like NADP-dependent oxidoreductase
MKKVIIIGAGGHGKVVADIVVSSGDEVAGFLDDDESIKECAGLKVLGKPEDYKKHSDCEFVIAVGKA